MATILLHIPDALMGILEEYQQTHPGFSHIFCRDHEAPDLIITDTKPPENPACPVLTLGNAVGGDAHLPLPLKLPALLGAVESLLSRRVKTIVLSKDCVLLTQEKKVKNIVNQCDVDVSDKEAAMLTLLQVQGDAGIDPETLLAQIWSYASNAATHTLETHIYRLRKKLRIVSDGEGIASRNGRYYLSI